MNRKILSPKNFNLDFYEQELEDALEQGFKKNNLSSQDKKEWAVVAQKYTELQKSKRITLSVNTGELLRFKMKAKRNRIPYQTLMGVIMKQYNDGEIKIAF